MDKNELKRRLEAAEKQNLGLLDEIKNLKAKLAEMQDEPEIPDFPEFKAGDVYWFGDTELKPHMSEHCNYTVEDFNEFHTEGYAQEFAKKCKLIAMLLHCKWYLCRDFIPKWSENALEKYAIYYSHKENKFEAVGYYIVEENTVFFDTEENAQKAADWLNTHYLKENADE
jgi:hypothetical protein